VWAPATAPARVNWPHQLNRAAIHVQTGSAARTSGLGDGPHPPLQVAGCDYPSKRRIDLWAVVGAVLVAVEIDGISHMYYEEARYDDLMMDGGGPICMGSWVHPSPSSDCQILPPASSGSTPTSTRPVGRRARSLRLHSAMVVHGKAHW
jgi:hypothetical protein